MDTGDAQVDGRPREEAGDYGMDTGDAQVEVRPCSGVGAGAMEGLDTKGWNSGGVSGDQGQGGV